MTNDLIKIIFQNIWNELISNLLIQSKDLIRHIHHIQYAPFND